MSDTDDHDETEETPPEQVSISGEQLLSVISQLTKPMLFKKSLPEPPEVELVSLFDPEIIYTVNHSLVQANFGAWRYDSETNTIHIEIAPHISSVALNLSLIQAYIQSNLALSSDISDYLMDYTTDVTKCSTCVHFGPSATMIDAGAEQLPTWIYNKAKKMPQCSNPDLVGKDNFDTCSVYPYFHNCASYTVSDWADIQGAYVNNECVMTLQRRFYGTRIPKYRVNETIYDDHAEAVAAFDQHVKELSEAGSEVSITDLDITSRNHLFNTILV
jgi:hypothetical protein